MLKRTCLVFGAIMATLISVTSRAQADELLGVNVFPGQHLALYAAKEKGLFAKRGLNVEITGVVDSPDTAHAFVL